MLVSELNPEKIKVGISVFYNGCFGIITHVEHRFDDTLIEIQWDTGIKVRAPTYCFNLTKVIGYDYFFISKAKL